MSWDPKTLANTVNNHLEHAQDNSSMSDSSHIELLAQKGNVVRKYQTLLHLNMGLMPPRLLARIITVDDDDVIFNMYRRLVGNELLADWIVVHKARSAAWIILPDMSEDTQSELHRKIASLAIYHCLSLPDSVNSPMLRELCADIESYDTRINLWAETIMLNGDAQYDYWKARPPDQAPYRGRHMCVVAQQCTRVTDIIEMWKSIYCYRHVFSKDKRVQHAITLIRTADRVDQINAWVELTKETDGAEMIGFACSQYFALEHDSAGELYIPYDNLGKNRYSQMINESVYPCNAVNEHVLHVLHDAPERLTAYLSQYFARCIDALLAVKKRLDKKVYKSAMDAMFQYWLPRAHMLPSGAYIRYFPLLEHINEICELAKKDVHVKVILCGQLRRAKSLDVVPSTYLHVVVPDLPELIDPEIFDTTPRVCLQTLERFNLHMTEELRTTVLSWLLLHDKKSTLCTNNSPVIDELEFGQFIRSLGTGYEVLASTSRNFCKMHTHILYYYIPNYRTRCFSAETHGQALLYGLRVYGHMIDDDVLDMFHDSTYCGALPHIAINGGYDDLKWGTLFQLYSGSLNKLGLTASAFVTLLAFDVERIEQWVQHHHDCDYDMSGIDIESMSRDMLLTCMANNIIDMNTVDLDGVKPEIKQELDGLDMCAICRLPIVPRCKAETACGHIFHMRCIATWLEEQETCPMCRADLPEGYDYYV